MPGKQSDTSPAVKVSVKQSKPSNKALLAALDWLFSLPPEAFEDGQRKERILRRIEARASERMATNPLTTPSRERDTYHRTPSRTWAGSSRGRG